MFENCLQRHRLSRERTLQMVRGTSQEKLDFRPADDKWSIGEVLDHLALAEDLVCQQIEAVTEQVRAGGSSVRRVTFQELDCAPAFLPVKLVALIERPLGWVNRTFVSNRIRDLITRKRFFRIRHPSRAEPRYGRPAGSHVDALCNSLNRLEQLLNDNRDQALERLRIIHPVLGKKSVFDLINFSIAHEQRHRKQIADVARAFDALPQVKAELAHAENAA